MELAAGMARAEAGIVVEVGVLFRLTHDKGNPAEV